MIKTNYDPYKEAKFKNYRMSGDTQEVPLMKNGQPVTQKDKNGVERQVMGPAIFLPRTTLTEWFWSAYPNGSILDELVSRTEQETIVKVTLAANREARTVITSSYGIANQKNTGGSNAAAEQEKDPYGLAYYIALLGAMEKAGFLLDYDPDILMDKIPGYRQACHVGEEFEGVSSPVGISTEVNGPSVEQIAKEEKIEILSKVMEENKIDSSDPLSALTDDKEETSRNAEEIEELLKKTHIEVDEDPLSSAVSTCEHTASKEEDKKPDSSEIDCHENADEAAAATLDAGDVIFSVSEKASLNLKGYDGEKIKDLPEAFVKNVAKKEDWRGLISEESLAAIKVYVGL